MLNKADEVSGERGVFRISLCFSSFSPLKAEQKNDENRFLIVIKLNFKQHLVGLSCFPFLKKGRQPFTFCNERNSWWFEYSLEDFIYKTKNWINHVNPL